MTRHPSLVPLSREHHGALILARLLQKGAPAYKGLPEDTAGKAAYATQFYQDELIPHFEEEEKMLKLVSGVKGTLDSMIQIITGEHRNLTAGFLAIPEHTDLPNHLHKLGKALEAHVRKEERELFPLIEVSCDAEQLAAIAQLLSPHS